MNCRTAESMLNSYISHSLSAEEVEEFLDHIESCSSCYDELETYYIVHKAMKHLDDDNDDSEVMDFQHLMEQEVKSSRKYVRRKKLIKAVRIIIPVVIVGLFLLFGVYYFISAGMI